MTLPPFRLERYFARYEFAVEHLLCGSDCESVTVGELLELEPGAGDALRGMRLGYTEAPGSPELRREIAGLYETIEPDDVLVFSGGEEAIFALMHAGLEPGERLFVHFPAYQSLHEVARARGCEVVLWRAREEDGWALDPSLLGRKLRRSGEPASRAVVINYPHNPTGALLGREALDELVGLVRKERLLLISDEAYRLLEYVERDRLPAACDLEETAVSLGVLSKSFGLPGLRIGWVATHDRQLLERLAGFKDYLTICSSAPSELLAALALRHRHHLVRRNRELIEVNLALLDDFMDRRRDSFEWVRPAAGPVAYPALRRGEGANAFCTRLLERTGVLLLPGSVFDETDHRHVRIGFGRRGFAEGLARLDEALEAW
ncbi:MAG TPA: aminotransferase class I/II-fold pyridoxal phosphate-dependent enzyme [Thermoanaerobaculia bacterium]|nr:aminotransferase class I/II-fold pyridoxal phosphate-dependent enzyme [Thermoanaerobaculia bacterium]